MAATCCRYPDGTSGRGAAARPCHGPSICGRVPTPELPAGLLPRVIEDYARASRIWVPTLPGLRWAHLRSLARHQRQHFGQVKEFSDGWNEEARIWVGLIGDPSTRNHQSFARWRPLRRIDINWSGSISAGALQTRQGRKEDADPPPQVRVCLEDTTIEAAQEVLKDSYGGVVSAGRAIRVFRRDGQVQQLSGREG